LKYPKILFPKLYNILITILELKSPMLLLICIPFTGQLVKGVFSWDKVMN